MEERHAEAEEFRKALWGLDFPAAKDAVYGKARDKGGIDTEVLYVLEHLPERTYESLADVESEIARVYGEIGGLEGAGPAAPTDATNRDKRIIEKIADPRAGQSH